jgi:hypothetical protein
MLEKSRRRVDESWVYEELLVDPYDIAERPLAGRGRMGLSAAQRFFLATMLLFAVVMIGSLCLLITGRVWPY